MYGPLSVQQPRSVMPPPPPTPPASTTDAPVAELILRMKPGDLSALPAVDAKTNPLLSAATIANGPVSPDADKSPTVDTDAFAVVPRVQYEPAEHKVCDEVPDGQK